MRCVVYAFGVQRVVYVLRVHMRCLIIVYMFAIYVYVLISIVCFRFVLIYFLFAYFHSLHFVVYLLCLRVPSISF